VVSVVQRYEAGEGTSHMDISRKRPLGNLKRQVEPLVTVTNKVGKHRHRGVDGLWGL
jgi:hypothetical protein